MLKIDIKKIIVKTSTSERTLLKDINFELEKNKIFTILGKNGTGKSTLIKCLMNLLDPDIYGIEGEVLWEDKNIFKIEYDELLKIRAKYVKYIFQDAFNSFNHLKKFDYYFKKFTINFEETDELLEYFLLPKKEKLFNMYPYEVSGGMAQRISFALALLTKPKVLILDEPTSGIDSAIANLILLKLKEFSEQEENSVLLVTHNFLFANKISDKIALIKDSTLTEFVDKNDFSQNYGLQIMKVAN